MVFGLGGTEIALIALALLVLFGPEHVPRVAKEVGRLRAQLRDAGRELRRAVDLEEDVPAMPSPSDQVHLDRRHP